MSQHVKSYTRDSASMSEPVPETDTTILLVVQSEEEIAQVTVSEEQAGCMFAGGQFMREANGGGCAHGVEPLQRTHVHRVHHRHCGTATTQHPSPAGRLFCLSWISLFLGFLVPRRARHKSTAPFSHRCTDFKTSLKHMGDQPAKIAHRESISVAAISPSISQHFLQVSASLPRYGP